MADLTLPDVITRFRGNEARIAEFANGNAAGYYTTTDGKKVETLPSVVSRLASAIAAASATADTLKGTGGAKLIGFGTGTVDSALATQAKGIADNAKAVADLDAGKLAKGGGTMTGPLTLAGAPTDALHAATKGWAEGLIGAYWKPGLGDVLTTTRGAPDANWIPDGGTYLQSAYPALFARLGLLGYDATDSSAWTGAATLGSSACAYMGVGKDGVLVVSDSDSQGPVLKRSTDGGLTFTTVLSMVGKQINSGSTDGALVHVVTCNDGTIYRSADNGLTWANTLIQSSTQLYTATTDKKGTWIIVTNGGFVMRSADNGLTWAKVTTSMTFNFVCVGAGGVWLASGAQANSTFTSKDNGLTWSAIQHPASQYTTVNYYQCGYSAGVFLMTGVFASGSSNYVMIYSASTDLVNWKTVTISNSTGYSYGLALDSTGIAIQVAYTQNAARITLGIDAAGAATIAMTAFYRVPTWAVRICCDGLGTWYGFGGSANDLKRCSPAYDVKTLFRVPKTYTPPLPFANFVKAK